MTSATKRGKTWQFKISMGANKPAVTKGGFRTKSEAIEAGNKLSVLLKQGYNAAAPNMTLPEYFKDWFETFKKGSIEYTTQNQYRSTLRILQKHAEYLKIKSISRTDYQSFLNDIAKLYSEGTVHNINVQIRYSIQNLVDEHVIPYDFTKKAIIKGTSKPKKEDEKFINYDEFKNLVEYTIKHISIVYPSHTFIFIAAMTGMRFSEIRGLTWENVDLLKGIITVRANYKLVGKDEEGKELYGFGETKNKESRIIPIDMRSRAILSEIKQKQSSYYEQHTIENINNLVCPSVQSSVHRNSAVNVALRRSLKVLNIDTPLTFHGLRHTHGSILLYKGVDIMTVSKRLGHKDVTTTMKVYAHIIQELEARETEKLRGILTEITSEIKVAN